MTFDPNAGGPDAAAILALDGNGQRLMPLAHGTCSSREAARRLAGVPARELFPAAPHPEAALAGMWLYFSCLEESHRVSQNNHDVTGSFWHAIMHRQEPDAGNSAYWFRRVGRHPVFDALGEAAAAIAAGHPEARFRLGQAWDPFAFLDFVEEARQRPGSPDERLALELQRAEWQLLFDYCVRP